MRLLLHSPVAARSVRTATSGTTTTTTLAVRPTLPSRPLKPTTRTLTTLPSTRPRIPSSYPTLTFRGPLRPAALPTSAELAADLPSRAEITPHPAFAGPGGQQVRFAMRPRMERTSRLRRKRRHGFLSRVRTRNGRRTLLRRTTKGRKVLSM